MLLLLLLITLADACQAFGVLNLMHVCVSRRTAKRDLKDFNRLKRQYFEKLSTPALQVEDNVDHNFQQRYGTLEDGHTVSSHTTCAAMVLPATPLAMPLSTPQEALNMFAPQRTLRAQFISLFALMNSFTSLSLRFLLPSFSHLHQVLSASLTRSSSLSFRMSLSRSYAFSFLLPVAHGHMPILTSQQDLQIRAVIISSLCLRLRTSRRLRQLRPPRLSTSWPSIAPAAPPS